MTDDVKSRLNDELGKEIFHLKEWIRRYEDSDMLGYKVKFEWLYEERKQLVALLQDSLTELDSRDAEIDALKKKVDFLQFNLEKSKECEDDVMRINQSLDAEVAALREMEVDVVFDGPPGPEAGRFVEVEDMTGKSISVGTWVEREDGFWALRIAILSDSQHSEGE